MEIKHIDIERGFIAGIQLCHQMSKAWHDRISLGKESRRLEKKFKEPLEARGEILRAFANDENGSVNDQKMSAEKFKEWKAAIEPWREAATEYKFENALPDGRLPIKLGAVSLRSIPYNIMEAMIDYVEFSEDSTQTKEEDSDAAIKKLQDELDKLKKK